MSEQINSNMEEQEIDLIKLVTDLWERRKFIFKAVGIGIVVGLIVAYSLPREYVSSAKLAPEFKSDVSSKLGSLGGLAAMAGISTGSGAGGDAISTTLYPDVVSSFPFMSELFAMPINTLDGEISTDLYDYMGEYQKAPWWSYVTSAPFKLLGFTLSLFKEKEEEEDSSVLNIETPTKDQYEIYKSLTERISVSVDTKTLVISVTSKMQDPQVALDVAKVVIANLQEYISAYRTQKVKNDLAYAEMVHKEAQEKYYVAQQRYATFEDENRNISSSRYRTEMERLRNEMTLSYSLYSTLSGTLEQTKLRVQEETPVYVTLEPASRPIKNAEPNKPLILIAFMFLAGVISVGYLIFRDKLIEF